MIYKLEWTTSAKHSFTDEIDFIFLKWSYKQVIDFEALVEKELCRLSKNPNVGIHYSHGLSALTISKQTTLFYRIKHEKQSIELILFWNNLKNPKDLSKLL